MSVKIETRVKSAIIEDVLSLGYELEYIEYIKEGDEKILRVVIDNEKENITIDDCENVSRSIDEKVEQVMGAEAYLLEVSSPGVERKLKNEFLYKKYVGRHIHINLYKAIKEGKSIEGKLISYNEIDSSIVIRIDSNIDETVIPLKDIASGYTTYDFNAVLNKKEEKDKE